MRNSQDKLHRLATKLNGRTSAATVARTLLSLATLIDVVASGSLVSEDFQVYTRAVLVSERSVDVEAQFNTFERYSASLSRGQLHLELAGSKFGQKAAYHSSYYSSDTLDAGKLLKVSSDSPQCKLVDGMEMALDLFGADQINSIPELKTLLNLLPNSEANRHVIGLARLLIFFDQHRDQFSPVNRLAGSTFKNLVVDVFSLELVENGARVVVVKVLLPPPQRAYGTRVAARNPMRMLFMFPSQVQFVVDFNQISHIRPALADSMLEQIDQLSLDSSDSSTTLAASRKLFNLPLGCGCGHLVDSTRSKAPRNPLKHPEEIYSFKFQLGVVMATGSTFSSSHVKSSFVAYDGLAQMLRVEPVHATGSSKHELTICDFKLGVKFHLGSGRDHSSQLVVDSQTGGHQLEASPVCTKARLSKSELLPNEPILPLEQLVYMGSGEVRGIESAIYETTTKRLPRTIFEPSMVLGMDQIENKNASAPNHHTLVYHLAANRDSGEADDSQQLLRLDVYDSESRHRFRVELFNFQWRLSEAPNGDQQHHLFTLSQRCEPPQSMSHLMQLNLELTQEVAAEVDLIELRHSSTRNVELIRRLTTLSSRVSGGQIVNLVSRLTVEGNEDSRARLKLLVRLSVLPAHIVSGPPLLQTRHIGTGMVSDHLVEHSSNSYTPNECFWEAARWAQPKWSASSELNARPQIGAIFTFCFSRCWIESEARLRPWPSETPAENKSQSKDPLPQLISDSFQVSQDPDRVFPCQLFLIEQVADQESTFRQEPDEFLLDELSSQLANKVLNVVGLDFKVTRNYIGRDPDQQLESNPSLAGVAFVLGRAGSELRQNIVWPATVEKASARLLEPETCHALCVANAACRSVSVCLNASGQLECLMSSIDVRELDFLRELREKLEASKRYQKSTSSEGAKIRLSTGLELRVSKRCQVRSKQAKDLFRKVDQTQTSNLYVNSFQAVADREQCAELCLKKNTGYFRRLARFQVEIEPPSGESDGKLESNSSNLAQALVKPDNLHDRHMDTLRYWCDRYKYLSLTASTTGAKRLREQLIKLSSGELKREVSKPGSVGLCYMARGRWARSDIKQTRQDGAGATKSRDSAQAKLIRVQMDTFEFRYSLLYQRQEGLRLAGVKSLADEGSEQVVDVASNQSAYFRLRNLQSIEEQPIDVEFCARQCFTQAVQWCRSFDLVRVDKTFYCIYNSLGLNEFHSMARSTVRSSSPTASMSNDEIDRWVIERPANGSRARFFHYEPLEAHALDIVKLKLAADDERDEQNLNSSHLFGSKRFYVVLGFGVLLTLLALMLVNEPNCRRSNQEDNPMIPEVNIARLSFSLPISVSANSSLLSQDQLELQHNATREEQIRSEQINKL